MEAKEMAQSWKNTTNKKQTLYQCPKQQSSTLIKVTNALENLEDNTGRHHRRQSVDTIANIILHLSQDLHEMLIILFSSITITVQKTYLARKW